MNCTLIQKQEIKHENILSQHSLVSFWFPQVSLSLHIPDLDWLKAFTEDALLSAIVGFLFSATVRLLLVADKLELLMVLLICEGCLADASNSLTFLWRTDPAITAASDTSLIFLNLRLVLYSMIFLLVFNRLLWSPLECQQLQTKAKEIPMKNLQMLQSYGGSY